jgi:hypothetical protein
MSIKGFAAAILFWAISSPIVASFSFSSSPGLYSGI